MQVWSLGWEDPLEKEMAINSSILALEISWTEEPGGLQSMRLQKSWTRISNYIAAEAVSGMGLRQWFSALATNENPSRNSYLSQCQALPCIHLSESRQGGIFKDSNVRWSLTTRGAGVFYMLSKAVVHWSHLGSLVTVQMPGPFSEIQKPVSLRNGCTDNKIPRGFCSC